MADTKAGTPDGTSPAASGNKMFGRNVLFGRQRGRPLSPHRRRLMDEALPALCIDISQGAPPALTDLFDTSVEQVILEIGIGSGEHLIAGAQADPATGFVGVEPFVYGLAKAVVEVDRRGLRNVRLFDDDAGLLLDWLPSGSISRIDLLYPDPWPKRRHHGRRFVSSKNIARAGRVLLPDAEFRVATDIPSYVDWTVGAFGASEGFERLGEHAGDWHRPYAGWTGTRYEVKALKAGRRPVYLSFVRS
jgi:tRNA (guanine-N7-)-methyltransferase